MRKMPTCVRASSGISGIQNCFRYSEILPASAEFRNVSTICAVASSCVYGRTEARRSLFFRTASVCDAAGKDGSFPHIVSNRSIWARPAYAGDMGADASEWASPCTLCRVLQRFREMIEENCKLTLKRNFKVLTHKIIKSILESTGYSVNLGYFESNFGDHFSEGEGNEKQIICQIFLTLKKLQFFIKIYSEFCLWNVILSFVISFIIKCLLF